MVHCPPEASDGLIRRTQVRREELPVCERALPHRAGSADSGSIGTSPGQARLCVAPVPRVSRRIPVRPAMAGWRARGREPAVEQVRRDMALSERLASPQPFLFLRPATSFL